ncbi:MULTISPECIES: response regulator transcription factor [unclassified Modestobacter]|uniref:response regulator transcription factor n=1 Tax=unclassified Modestobacter TaxID=2643866 RepID=UPI0022AAABF1|nr:MULTISPECIES: response regulator transcription factor [unclassified Modestobacter]MCZ2822843.1 response regulator transcription factor [Modestobacter sp. VKM Ac-2981]MCZ2851089.1 response regulator transcription factor [Modestobacter sp. VKM Ac-2982]
MSLADPGTDPGHVDARRRAAGPPSARALLHDVVVGPAPAPPRSDLRPCAQRPPRPLVRVLLCEDQEVFRLGLRSVFEAQPDIAVVAETADLAEVLAAADGPGSRVVVVRQSLVGSAALPVLRELCQRGVGVLVLAEANGGSRTGLMDVLQCGVRGFLPRRAAAQRLVEAVRALARQEPALDADVTSQLVRQLTGEVPRPTVVARALDRLTERQREVAELVAQGLSNEEIAGRLFLSSATVKSHLTAVMRRLDVRTRTQLAILVNRDHAPAA